MENDDDNHPEKLKVLIVDDAPSIRKMLSMLLKRCGVPHDSAENGRVAVEMAMAQPSQFRLVLMDNLMPEMDVSVGR
jgi:CheY-like chemotaxis protein